MSKKSRSYKNKRKRVNATTIQEGSLSARPDQASVDRQRVIINTTSNSQSQNNQYQYLIPELRRIGILSGAIVLILIILSFVLG